MDLRTVAVGLLCLFGSSSAGNATDSVCQPDSYVNYSEKYDVKASANLLSRLLSSLGISGAYERDSKQRLPTQDDRVIAIITFGTICRMVMQDSTLTTIQRTEILKGWMISIAGYSQNKGSWNDFGLGDHRTAGLVLPPALPAPLRAFTTAKLVRAQVSADTSGVKPICASPSTSFTTNILSPPPPPRKGQRCSGCFSSPICRWMP
jgi:hypothetical protein